MFKNLKNLNLLKLFKLQGKEAQLIFIVVIVLFVVANFLVSGFSFRYDASAGQAYTLSASSKKILHDLDDIVNIKFFVSADLPARLSPLKTEVVDILSEYKKEAGDKIKLKIADPKKDEGAAKEAREANIPELQFSQLEQDKYAVTTAYFGIHIAYGGRNEVIPQVNDFENFEYNLTSAINKLVKKDLPRVGLIGNVVSPATGEDGLTNFRRIMGQQFNLEPLNIATESGTVTIDKSYSAIIVLDNNNKEFTNGEVQSLRNYLSKKGKLVILADGVWTSEQLITSEAKHNLFSLLKDYGLVLERNLILSGSSELVNFGTGEVSLLLPYPFWFKTNNFNPEIAYFSNINQLTFPWGSGLRLEKKNNLEIKELVKTTTMSWQQNSNFVLNPQQIQPPSEKDYKVFLVAAEAAKKNEGQIVIIPSSRFIQDSYLGTATDNLELVLNIVSNYASEGALSGIRSRAVSFYPLPNLTEAQKDTFKYANILFFPVLFAAFGSLRLLRRR